MRAPSTLLLAACLVLAAVAGTAAGGPAQQVEPRATPAGQGPAPGASPAATDPPSAAATQSSVGAPAGQDAAEFAVVAAVPAEDGERRTVTVLTGTDVASAGDVETGRNGLYRVPVTLTEAGAAGFVEDLRRLGFTESGTTCDTDAAGEDRGRCLHTVVDGEVVYSAGLSVGLAERMRSGAFVEDPQFAFFAERRPQAEAIAMALDDASTPDETGSEAAAMVADTGVAVVAQVAGTDGRSRYVTVLSGADVATVSGVEQGAGGAPFVTVGLTDAAATDFAGELQRLGFAETGGTDCDPDESGDGCLHTVVDGRVVYSAGVGEAFAERVRTGEFADDARLRLLAANASTARELKRSLRDAASNATTTGNAGAGATGTKSGGTPGDETDDGSGGSDDTDGGSLPGFGALAALVALAAGALPVRRRP